jgi:hypothetical protein
MNSLLPSAPVVATAPIRLPGVTVDVGGHAGTASAAVDSAAVDAVSLTATGVHRQVASGSNPELQVEAAEAFKFNLRLPVPLALVSSGESSSH